MDSQVIFFVAFPSNTCVSDSTLVFALVCLGVTACAYKGVEVFAYTSARGYARREMRHFEKGWKMPALLL